MGLVRSIDLPLKAFANFISHPPNDYYKGLIYELLVASTLWARGWELIYHRKKIAGYEVDLVLRFGSSRSAQNQILLIEVKSKPPSPVWHCFPRFTFDQNERFKNVVFKLQNKYPNHNIMGALALLDPRRVEFLFLDEV